MMNQAKEVVLRKKTSSVKRKSSKRASGDWNQIRKTYSDVFDDEWSVDTINTSEQLKITQELLVQANEIIMTMTEENEKASFMQCLQVNFLFLCHSREMLALIFFKARMSNSVWPKGPIQHNLMLNRSDRLTGLGGAPWLGNKK